MSPSKERPDDPVASCDGTPGPGDFNAKKERFAGRSVRADAKASILSTIAAVQDSRLRGLMLSAIFAVGMVGDPVDEGLDVELVEGLDVELVEGQREPDVDDGDAGELAGGSRRTQQPKGLKGGP